MSLKLANLGNDHEFEFISKRIYLHWHEVFLGKFKANPRDFMLKWNNIISLWRGVIHNTDVNFFLRFSRWQMDWRERGDKLFIEYFFY